MSNESPSVFDDPAGGVPMTPRHHSFYQERSWRWYEPIARQMAGCRRVLDLGCGPGLLLECLVHLGVTDAVGLERDPVFLELCASKGLNVIAHDLSWPFPFLETESFDAVVSHQVFDYITDLAKVVALREAWRVLRPGGVIRIYSQSRHNPRAAQDAARVGMTTPSELARMLRDAGFDAVSLAGNTLGEAPGRDPAELKREWLLNPDDRLSLTANAAARKPMADARAAPAPSEDAVLELWRGVEPPRAFGKWVVAPWHRAVDRPLLGPTDKAWCNLSVRDAALLATPEKAGVRLAGKLVMFFTAYGGSKPELSRAIGRAESDDGLAWQVAPSDPVLQGGAPGEWDDGGVAAGSVIALSPDRYLMYYSGRNQDTRFLGIGLAESDDSIHWRKRPGNPILTVDDYADLRHLALADVFRASDGRWVMHLEGWNTSAGGFRVYQAIGDSPKSFTPSGNGSWVLGCLPDTWQSHHVANPKCLELEPGRYLMAYNGATAGLDFQIGLAVSEDLAHWQRYSRVPVLSRSYPLCSDGYRIESGFVLADEIRGGAGRMWYFGSDTRDTTVGCHLLMAEQVAGGRTPDWERWTSAYTSLYQVGEGGLVICPGASQDEQGISRELGPAPEALISLALSSPGQVGGRCTFGWRGGEPWLTLEAAGSVKWTGEEPGGVGPAVSQGQRLSAALRVKRRSEGGLAVELMLWAGSRTVLREERLLAARDEPLTVCCSSSPGTPEWTCDHLLYLNAGKHLEGGGHMQYLDSHLYLGRHRSLEPPLEQLGPDEIIAYLDREGVQAALVMPYASVPQLDGFDQIRLAQQRAPQRIFPVCRMAASVEKRPEARARIVQQLEADYARGCLYGLKIHMAFERPHAEVLDWCERRGLPTVWHLRSVEDFEWLEREVLAEHTFPVILAHLGGYPADRARYERAIGLLDRFQQIHLETSCVSFHHYLMAAIRKAPERVLFGSDGPAVSPRAARAVIESLPCADETKRLVLEANLRRLLDGVAQRRAAAAQAGELPNLPLPDTPEGVAELGFVVTPPSAFPPDEDRRAKGFWAAYPLKGWYKEYKPWVDILQDYVAALKPRKVMEFGCNVGRNLYYLREAFPEIELHGVDINPAAVEQGRQEFGLDLAVADESLFEQMEPDSFDLIYTVSVLDHMPEIEAVCQGLLRCAGRHVLCLEVALPVEGKVVKHFDHAKQSVIESTGYSYSWDYVRAFGELGAAWVDVRSIYLHPLSLGPYYQAFLVHK